MAEDFIEQWLASKDRDPDKLSEYVVKNDRWDRKYVGQMLETIDDFLINHEMLTDKVETGSPMWSDLFWLLWKYEPDMEDPKGIKPSHLINHLVGGEMSELPDYQRMKFFAEGDDVSAALACIDLRPTLEQLFDKLKQLQEKLKELMGQMRQLAAADQESRDIDEMYEQWKNGFNPDLPEPGTPEGDQQDAAFQEDQQGIQQKIEALEQAIREAGETVNAEADAAGPVIGEAMKGAMKEAADNAEAGHAQGDLWGSDQGALLRMSSQERMDLARKLQDKRFRRLLDLIGPMRRIMEEAQMRKVDYARDEVYRITMGDDLSRVLPSEMVKLHHPLLKKDFLRKYVEKELPQYDLRGKEKVGRGEIIACLDNSGSMMGDKEMWGKAVAICALHLSRKQKRGFYGIHFGSAREIMTFDFGTEEEFTPQKVIDYAEFFFNGGTDFMRPLSLALDRLKDEHARTGKLKGDIMFITDGICSVSDSWLKAFKEEQERLEFKVWGFLIGGYGKETEPLHSICDGKVYTVQDLLDPAGTKDMFGGI